MRGEETEIQVERQRKRQQEEATEKMRVGWVLSGYGCR